MTQKSWITVPRLPYIFIGFLLIVVLFLWSPWMTQANAEQRVVQAFEETWAGVVDGCGFNCPGCGVVESHRRLFGVVVTIEYGCGVQSAQAPQPNERHTVFVSSLGALHGLPTP